MLECEIKAVNKCLKVVENKKVVDLNQKEYMKRADAVALPPSKRKDLEQTL